MEFPKPRWMQKSPNLDSESILNTDSVRALELHEMREEEKYLQALKNQMEKFEIFKQEMRKKEQKIEELQIMLKEAQILNSKSKETESENQILKHQLECKEKENHELRQKIRKQVEEYESSLKEVQTIVYKEREERNADIKALKKKLKEKEENFSNIKVPELENKLAELTKIMKEKEKQALNNMQTWKGLEKVLKDEVTELSNEKFRMERKISELTEENSELFMKVEDMLKENEKIFEKFQSLEKISEIVKDYKKTKEELNTTESKQKELIAFAGKCKKENEELQQDLSNLNEEMNKAIDIIKRQENSMLELREKNQENILMIEELQDDNADLKRKLQSLKITLQEKHISYEKLLKKSLAQEKKLGQLETTLKTCIDKENAEKLEREKKAKKKIELFTQRTAEVNKLAEVIQSFTLDTSYSTD